MAAIWNWFLAHGGVIGVVLVLNLALSFVKGVVQALHLNVGGWFGTAMAALGKIVDWLSANVAHPDQK
jgi:hypothetical protein